jgi:hypothetical protein
MIKLIKIDPWEQNLHNQQNSQNHSNLQESSGTGTLQALSVWSFFEHVSSQLKGEAPRVCLNQYINVSSQQLIKLPSLKNDQETQKFLDALEMKIDVFSNMVDQAAKGTNSICGNFFYLFCFCKCICLRNGCKKNLTHKIYDSSNEILFGELTQCKLIMEKNFEGK